MKLLFDQNISYKVVKGISSVFRESQHVSDVQLSQASDLEIWEYAKNNDLCIVSFDHDFIDLSTLKGNPLKIIWLRTGNTSTENIISLFQNSVFIIEDFLQNNESSFLELR